MPTLWVPCLLALCCLSAEAAALYKRTKRQAFPETVASGSWAIKAQGTNIIYTNNLEEKLQIQTDPFRQSNVIIDYDVEIEESSDCAYDVLILNDGSSNSLKLCGNQKGRYTITNVEPGEDVILVFRTDLSVTKRGFTLNYTVTAEDTQTDVPNIAPYSNVDNGGAPVGRSLNGDGTSIHGDSGTLTSPNYPSEYESGIDLVYRIYPTTQGQQILLNYTYEIEYEPACLFDYLQIGDTKFCGQGQNQMLVDVLGSYFEFRFYTDNAVNEKGFNLSYQVVPDVEASSSDGPSDRLLSSYSHQLTETVSDPSAGDQVQEIVVFLPPDVSVTSGPDDHLSSSYPHQPNETISDPTPVDQIHQIDVFLPPDGYCGVHEWFGYTDGYEYAVNTYRDFYDAAQSCYNCRGELITARNDEEIAAAHFALEASGRTGTSYWLGASDIHEEGTFRWIDGTPIDASTAVWKNGQPDNLDQSSESDDADCVAVNSNGKWLDQDCRRNKRSICKRIPEVPEPQVFTFCDVCEASGNIGIVQSPGFWEQGYSNYQDCTITIRLEQQGPQRVNVTLDYFETALDCDYLFIDGDERNWFSGSWSGESMIVNVTDYTFTMRFKSGNLTTSGGVSVNYNLLQE